MTDNEKGTSEQGGGWIGRARRFLTEVRSELTRVTWPARRVVWATTVVVVIVSLLFGVYLYAVDLGASAAVRCSVKMGIGQSVLAKFSTTLIPKSGMKAI